MSVEAITWALSQPLTHSSAKFVLVVMANRADEDMICWPSIVDLCKQTSQDRKTVQENMRRLREWGFIEDTGFRKGATKQVIVYRLKTPKNGPVDDVLDTPSAGIKGAENGTLKEAQKRGASKDETGPKFPHNKPEIPIEEAQNSHETGPKTGHGTVKEPSLEPSGNQKRSGAKKSKPTLTPLPEDFGISERVRRWASEKGFGQLEAHLENFIGAAKAKNYQYADWDEAFMGAIRKDWANVNSRSHPRTAQSGMNKQEALEHRNREIAEQLAGESR